MYSLNSVCLIVLTVLVASPCMGAPEQVLVDWEACAVGEPGGATLVTPADASQVKAPVVTDAIAADGKRSLAVDYDFGPDLAGKMVQAEMAKLNGCGPYQESHAVLCGAVGSFGETAGDSIVFEKTPQSSAITIFYNTPSEKRCGLYVNEQRVATLAFPRTADWHSPFQRITWEGPIAGTVKLQADAEDVAANKDFCVNVDQVVFGAVKDDPSFALCVGLGGQSIAAGMDYFNFAMRIPYLGVATIAVVDVDGVEHACMPQDQWREDYWAHVSRRLDSFTPPLASGTAVKSLKLSVRRRGLGGRGTVYIDSVKFTQGWPNNPPADCPFERSAHFSGVVLTGRHAEYTDADTWYPSWASDGNLYSPYTDGTVEGVFSRSDNLDATTGMAKIEGDDPMQLRVSSLGLHASSPWPYAARYPSASLWHNGIWYYGTYIINADMRPLADSQKTAQGPFVGFRYSSDFGKTWTETPCTPTGNLFGELVDKIPGGYSKIKMCSPHFVDFGQNMQHSPDGKAYLVAHGNVRADSEQYWLRGDEVFLARVSPSPADINDIRKWEFFCGYDQRKQAMWTSRFQDIRPMFTWNDNAGCTTITYNAPLKRYFMVVSWGIYGGHPFDTYILESESVAGPWKLVTYMEQFGRQAYFVNIPSKFISADGRTMWLCYSANWTGHAANPPGGRYAMCLQEFQVSTAQ